MPLKTLPVQPGRAYIELEFCESIGSALMLHVDMPEFINAVERLLPGAKKLITSSGAPLPIVSRVDDASLRAAYPGLLRIPLDQGLRETIEVFKRRHAEGKLEV